MPERKLDDLMIVRHGYPPGVCDPRDETAAESEKGSKDVHKDEWAGGRLLFYAPDKF